MSTSTWRVTDTATGRSLLSDRLHQRLQALDAGGAGEDARLVVLPVRVLLGIEHELEGPRVFVQVVERTAKSYTGAISGVISTWAMEAGITGRRLLEIRSAKKLSRIISKINEIDVFQDRNTKGKGMYSSALNAYGDYLADISTEDIQEDITSYWLIPLLKIRKRQCSSMRE